METKIDVVYAFTKDGEGGNAAGVVLDAASMADATMQSIAAQANFSESTFFCGDASAEGADHRVRFFAPLREVPLCGHGTIAGYAHFLQQGKGGPGTYKMWTKAGVQRIDIHEDGLVVMSQNTPRFGEVLDPEMIAPLLGLEPSDFAADVPIQIVSTGLNKILAPIKSLARIKAISPDLDAIKAMSLVHEVTGIYTFTQETERSSTAHCRNFAPAVGISEDAATGTSCAALSCLLFHYNQIDATQAQALSFEQGYEIGEPSEILAALVTEGDQIRGVKVMGRATQRGQISVEVPDAANTPEHS